MKEDLLNSHIDKYLQARKSDPVKMAEVKEDRVRRIQLYASWNEASEETAVYLNVLVTHQRLEAVNQTINALNLVPKGFGG
jgi:hypothetical protein